MSIDIYFSEACTLHDPSPGHPEQPQRLRAIRQKLDDSPLLNRRLHNVDHSLSIATASRAHEINLLETLQEFSPLTGVASIDGDTTMDPHTLAAALSAAGSVDHAMREVCAGRVEHAFCAVRPPGHHATATQAMGFCFLNSIALAAYTALDDLGLERVAIIDFDVHHGNGTEDIVRGDERILFCSSYEFPLYPMLNSPNVPGQRINVPLPGATSSKAFRAALDQCWWPELAKFRPQLILVSAGFDAHRLDPLASMQLETADFAWLGQRIATLASNLCDGRIVAALEGGYHLSALADSVDAFTGALSE